MPEATIPLADLPAALAAKGYETPTYKSCYNAAIHARIPAARNGRTRVVRAADLDVIAEAMSLPRADARAAA